MKRDATWKAIAKDKAELRRKAADKPFSEKLRMVEKMRDRDAAVRSADRPMNSRGRGSGK